MRYTLPAFLLLASPAAAHHEAVVISVLPTVLLWAMGAAVGALISWRRWKGRK